MLLHDNSPAYGAIHVYQFLTQKIVAVLQLSPDVDSADFFLFPRLKADIKDTCFTDVIALKDCVTAILQ